MARGGDSCDLQNKGKGGEERARTDLLFYSWFFFGLPVN